MDLNQLIATGLTEPQAESYIFLLETGGATPPQLAKRHGFTRSNAYKLLDTLMQLGLATKKEVKKKFTYYPNNPLALTKLSNDFRLQAALREEAISSVMHELLTKFNKHSDAPIVEIATGRKDCAAAYRKQLDLKEDIHFIRTTADIPLMGYETMAEIRTAPSKYGNKRKALMAPPDKGMPNYASHKRTQMDVTWIDKNCYDSPVEWSVTKSSLLIVLYANEPHAILIVDRVVAAAFLQIFFLLDNLLRSQPTHKKWSLQESI